MKYDRKSAVKQKAALKIPKIFFIYPKVVCVSDGCHILCLDTGRQGNTGWEDLYLHTGSDGLPGATCCHRLLVGNILASMQ